MAKSIIWTLSKEEIQDKVNQCNSISDMLEAFGYQRSNGSMSKVMKKVIDTYNIDTSHFRSFKRTNQKPIYSLEEILVPNSKYENIARLKKRILKAGLLKYECECCGNKGEWNGKPLVLQLDHKDGNHNNHSIENLRFLCPNCHSQTNTYSGKNAKHEDRYASG
jgi:conserved domain protein